jgi:hypothetical protein
MERSNFAILVIASLGGLVFLIGVVLLVLALVSRRKADASQKWPVVGGRVITASLLEHSSSDPEDYSSTMYEPAVEYEFPAGGETVKGRRIAFGANRFDRGRAQRILDRYPPGSLVNVHYNPQNPHEAVLETAAAGGKVLLIVGIVFAALGLLGCCAGSVGFFLIG